MGDLDTPDPTQQSGMAAQDNSENDDLAHGEDSWISQYHVHSVHFDLDAWRTDLTDEELYLDPINQDASSAPELTTPDPPGLDGEEWIVVGSDTEELGVEVSDTPAVSPSPESSSEPDEEEMPWVDLSHDGPISPSSAAGLSPTAQSGTPSLSPEPTYTYIPSFTPEPTWEQDDYTIPWTGSDYVPSLWVPCDDSSPTRTVSPLAPATTDDPQGLTVEASGAIPTTTTRFPLCGSAGETDHSTNTSALAHVGEVGPLSSATAPSPSGVSEPRVSVNIEQASNYPIAPPNNTAALARMGEGCLLPSATALSPPGVSEPRVSVDSEQQRQSDRTQAGAFEGLVVETTSGTIPTTTTPSPLSGSAWETDPSHYPRTPNNNTTTLAHVGEAGLLTSATAPSPSGVSDSVDSEQEQQSGHTQSGAFQSLVSLWCAMNGVAFTSNTNTTVTGEEGDTARGNRTLPLPLPSGGAHNRSETGPYAPTNTTPTGEGDIASSNRTLALLSGDTHDRIETAQGAHADEGEKERGD